MTPSLSSRRAWLVAVMRPPGSRHLRVRHGPRQPSASMPAPPPRQRYVARARPERWRHRTESDHYRAVMAEPERVRRASYGAASPVVGARGARTRQQIVDVALQLFAERGFHGTVVEDIARSVGISRATLYQYFASKEEIFRELVEESGSAQLRVMRRLGRLGPTAEGFDNLHWWLGECHLGLREVRHVVRPVGERRHARRTAAPDARPFPGDVHDEALRAVGARRRRRRRLGGPRPRPVVDDRAVQLLPAHTCDRAHRRCCGRQSGGRRPADRVSRNTVGVARRARPQHDAGSRLGAGGCGVRGEAGLAAT